MKNNTAVLFCFVLLVLNVMSDWSKCPSTISFDDALPTACDDKAKCCTHPFSSSKWGCCPLGTDAVCCNNTYTCCPSGHVCHDSGSGWRVVTQCIDPTKNHSQPGIQICKPGPAIPFSKTLKNIVIVGDSVSIGYTPQVAKLMADTALVQHSPYAGDGGAEETAYGWQCIEYFLHASNGDEIKPDLLYFQWGLHNLVPDNASSVVPGQSGYQKDYLPYLKKITQRILKLKASGTKVLFGLTSPEMCSKIQDDIVLHLNQQAAALMKDEDIQTVDLHSAVIKKCGPVPQEECLGEKHGGCPHYSSDGYLWIANSTLVPAFNKILAL